MEKVNHIKDIPLPLSQNFQELRERGLSYIQKFGSSKWTNLNQGDPGVTILEQLCYALSELGYCGDFPIEDLLTQSNGKINYDAQFYMPDDILTTSPVTIDDYRKLVVDNFKEVINVMILPNNEDFDKTGKRYKIFLYVDRLISMPEYIRRHSENDEMIFTQEEFNADLSFKVYILLNKFRNIDEFFSIPEVLLPKSVLLEGTIKLDAKKQFEYKMLGIQKSLDNYVFSEIKQQGYQKLRRDGVITNDLFNGPKLEKGWVAPDLLKGKKDVININDIELLISKQDGVLSLSKLNFETGSEGVERQVSSSQKEYVQIEIIDSINTGKLKVFFNDTDLAKARYKVGEPRYLELNELGQEKPTGVNIMPAYLGITLHEKTGELYDVSSINMQPDLPEGKYREIDDYYPIQNTFPEVYAVGINAMKANQTAYEVAQSRQLIGYLSLFDQVLANQFAQLANLPNIFTFKNSIAEDPYEQNLLDLDKNDLEQYFSRYPVPYLGFSPTYYYQTLYNVENIRPVLKRHNTYEFEDTEEDSAYKEKNSWTAYKADAYNPYIYGLKKFMESDEVNTERRNDILNHLLARHGESPLLIEKYIEGSEYTGKSDKDKVIYKSLYLQNLGLISYYRMKATNFLEASRIRPKVPKRKLKIRQIKESSHLTNFIFNSPYVDKAHKLEHIDFANYSAIELKLNLLFGLSVQYLNFIKLETLDIEGDYTKIQLNRQALWFLNERKGLILLETNLLRNYATFLVEIYDSELENWIRLEDRLGIHELIQLKLSIYDSEVETKLELEKEQASGENELDSDGFIAKIGNLMVGKLNYGFSLIDKNDALDADVDKDEKKRFRVVDENYGNGNTDWVKENNIPGVCLFFPSYIPQFSGDAFQERVDLFLSENLPINVTYKVMYYSYDKLKELIPLITHYHNSLLKKKRSWSGIKEVANHAAALINFLSINIPNESE